ncbi:hypothetical protein QTI66_00085 [Variovorax sp. J22R133]|uniref:hypothetical protein n=1 Tax=Variovorax brevis TaxID=3053503 RepID=UPI002575AF08|nr:hypothetical protein [Variovorax sp. J22R133]MDM0110527.1 hypothetical protein [Variovorax sp. J22R133]
MKRAMTHQCSPALGRRDAVLLLAALGLTPEMLNAQDAAKTEPRSYRVVLENDKVRVVQYDSRPGIGVCGAGRHSHPDHVVVAMTPAKVKVTMPDGKTVLNNLTAGAVLWDPAATHVAENVGGSGARLLLIEIKDKDWKPATG